MKFTKLLIGLLAVILVLVVLFRLTGGKTKISPLGSKPEITSVPHTSVIPTQAPGLMFLAASKSSLKVGEKVKVTVNLYAEKKSVSGSDAIVKFDPAVLKADSTVETGDYFRQYPLKAVDNSKGIARVTAFLPAKEEPMTEMKVLLGITFTALKAGDTTVTIEFVPGTTNRSSIVESKTSRNLLGTVKEVRLTINP